MTYNELKKLFKGYKLRTTKEDWDRINKTKGNCLVEDYRDDKFDKEVFFETIE